MLLKKFKPRIRLCRGYAGQVPRIWNSLLSQLARRYLSRLYLLSRCSHQLDSWVFQTSEISRQSVAVLLVSQKM